MKTKLLALCGLLWTTAAATFAQATASAPATTSTSQPATTREAAVNRGDRLRVSVFELITPGLPYSEDVDVDKEGNISLPGLGNIAVAGMTPGEIEATIGRTVFEGIKGPMPKGNGRPAPGVIVERLAPTQLKVEPAASQSGAPVLHAGDHLRFEIAGDGGSSREATVVDKNGDIEISDLGKLHVAGVTVKDLENQVKTKIQTRGIMSVTIDMIPHAVPEKAGAHPGDHLRVSMFELETPGLMYDKELTIDKDGDVELPHLRKVNVVSLDEEGIKEIILQRAIEVASGLHPYTGPLPPLSVQLLPAASQPGGTSQSQPATGSQK